MMTATQKIITAIAEGYDFKIDHETRAFVGFRFRCSSDTRDTVVRIHREAKEFAAIAALTA